MQPNDQDRIEKMEKHLYSRAHPHEYSDDRAELGRPEVNTNESWKGEERVQDLVQKAREAKDHAQSRVFRKILVGSVIFFVLAMILFAGYEVAYTSELSGGETDCTDSVPCLERNFVIRQDDTTGDTYGSWMAWVFVGLGILSAMLFFMELFPA